MKEDWTDSSNLELAKAIYSRLADAMGTKSTDESRERELELYPIVRTLMKNLEQVEEDAEEEVKTKVTLLIKDTTQDEPDAFEQTIWCESDEIEQLEKLPHNGVKILDLKIESTE